MTYGQAVVLGIVQGLTEFLPVSSSGHLILVPHVLGWPDQGLAFDAAVHLGTLAALLAYFQRELRALLSGALSRRVAFTVAGASVPALAAGLLLNRWIEHHLRGALVVAAATAFWALVMWLADRRAVPATGGREPLEHVGWRRGLAIGCAQALALIPGTSRSGITITVGLAAGLDRATAARFSFLLGIPVTGAAGAWEALAVVGHGVHGTEAGPFLIAVVAAFVSGLAAVWFLVSYLKRRSLTPFVLYRLVLAAAIAALTLR